MSPQGKVIACLQEGAMHLHHFDAVWVPVLSLCSPSMLDAVCFESRSMCNLLRAGQVGPSKFRCAHRDFCGALLICQEESEHLLQQAQVWWYQ